MTAFISIIRRPGKTPLKLGGFDARHNRQGTAKAALHRGDAPRDRTGSEHKQSLNELGNCGPPQSIFRKHYNRSKVALMYSIRVVETCSTQEVELCRVASNPEPIARAAREVMANRKRRIKRYTAVRI